MGLVTPVDPVPADQLGRVHFIGIGGTGMTGVARVMLARGLAVSGCDTGARAELDELAALGAGVHASQSLAHLDTADTVVISTAIRPENTELAEARRRGLTVLHRAAALGSLMLGRRSTAVAGTHGKTTTTSMLTTVLRQCGADPGYVIGGILAETGLPAEDGAGADFVVEADESDGSFLMLPPQAVIITNIEADHLDNYSDITEIRSAFAAFTRRIADGGLLVASADDQGARAVAAAARGLPLRVRTFGFSPDADYRISDVTPHGMGISFAVTATTTPFGQYSGVISAAVPGRHNALNGAAAFAAAVELGFRPDRAAAGLSAYRGARRRMEPKGEADGVRVLDTYAHHPTELAADLAAARDIAEGGRLIAIFQPHLVSRTKLFARDLGAALALADEVIVLDVYSAREDPDPAVTGRLVADAVPGGRAHYVAASGEAPAAVAEIAKPGDIVLTMGAGDVTSLGPALIGALSARRAGPVPAEMPPGPDAAERTSGEAP